MPSATSLSPESRFVALFIGPKHSGKTVAACSFIDEASKKEGKRVYDFDFDGRIRGLLDAPYDISHVEYDYYPPRAGKLGVPFFTKVNDRCDVIQQQCSVGMCPYETLVTDSLTSECQGLLSDAIPLTHQGQNRAGGQKGKFMGALAMAGPEDYGFEATGTYQFLAFLRSVPIKNIIVTAHVVDKFGKADPDDKYSESIVVGEKLSIRDKIGANVGIYFDHIFRFDRRMVGGQERFFVKFRSDIACTSYPNLPVGELDISGRSFYQVLRELVRKPALEVAK